MTAIEGAQAMPAATWLRNPLASQRGFYRIAGAGWLAICVFSLLATATLLRADETPNRRGAEWAEGQLRCAAHDIRLRTLIDDLSETAEATIDEIVVASFLHREGLAACRRGDFAEAFEAFEAIVLPEASLTLLEDLRAAAWLAADREPRRTRQAAKEPGR